jgi:PAS domain S-box-containing protein
MTGGDIMAKKNNSILTNKKQIVALLVILSLVIAAAGYFYYKNQESSIRQQKYNELKAIADLKVNQIEEWIKERKSDVIGVVQLPFFVRAINQWLNDTGNVQLKQDIIEHLRLIQKENGYENIFLTTANGRLLLSVKTELEEFHTLTKQTITETSKKGKIVFTDFYFCQKENKIHYDIIAPIIYNENKTIAILLFRRNPNDYLYPLINTWPTLSKSAETLLLRIEKDSVLFLNELLHRKNSALKLKISLTRTELPAVQAAFGHTGIFEGIDYRGVEVLSDIRKIPVTNWFMVAKVDKSEIYSDLYLTAIVISGFTIFLIIICGVSFAFIYNSRQKNIFMELYNKEKELWQSQEKFKVTMDSLGDGVITTDFTGKIQYINKIAEELSGWNFREARGRMLSEVYYVKNEETGRIESNILEKVVNQGIVKELANHTILISKSGKEIPVMDTGSPIYDNDGSIIGIVIAFQDETEKRRQNRLLKESEERFRSLYENSTIGIYRTTLEGQILLANPTLVNMLGFLSFEELAARNLEKDGFEPTYERKQFLESIEINGEIKDLESSWTRKDGTSVYMSERAKAIRDLKGKTLYYDGTVQDITERKLAEQELLIANKELVFQNEEKEKRAAELIIANKELVFQNEEKEKRTTELIIAKERAEQSDKLKTEFLSQMSHEIRTPINIMIGNVDYLNYSFGEKMDSDTRGCFDAIDLASKRIIRTVELILNMAELHTSGYKPQLVEVDLNSEILNKLYQEHQLSAQQKGIEIIYICKEKDTKVIADEYSITQIFTNLIDNAIKYTKKGKVEILLVNNKTINIMVEVKDTGIGISKEFLPKLFEPFVQEEQGFTRSFDGNGLGLTLVKKYCDINNAVIEVESEKNVGSTFRIIFDKKV